MKKMLLTIALLGMGSSLLADCCKRSCNRCEDKCEKTCAPKCVKYVKKCVKPCKRVECETIYTCPPGTREDKNGE